MRLREAFRPRFLVRTVPAGTVGLHGLIPARPCRFSLLLSFPLLFLLVVRGAAGQATLPAITGALATDGGVGAETDFSAERSLAADGCFVAESSFAAEATKGGEPAGAADKLTLKDGKTLEGTLLDRTDAKVLFLVGSEKKRIAPGDVKEIARGADKKVLDFVAKKFADFRKADDAKSWKSLADLCKKKGLHPEYRNALRELVRVDPGNAEARAELGHALFEGRWIDEDETEAKVKEGYELADGKLVKPSKVTAVAKSDAPPGAYKVLTREKLTSMKRKMLEEERQKRLKSMQAFLKQKEKEYEGVPWDKRFEVSTAHFIVQCNSTLQVTRAYGELMELIRAELAKMFPSKILRNIKAPVFIYASQEDFISQDRAGRWMGRGLGGYYRPDNQSITTYHGTFGFTGTTFGVLCHEGTHYYEGLVLQKFDNIPIWLIEGLAVYFGDGSVFDPKKKRISVGHIPRDRLAHIQEKMLARRHTPIDKLVVMDRYGGFSGSTYADAWALIYYLVNSGDDGKSLLTNYWNIGLNRQIDKKDFKILAERFFGSVAELEKKYVDYIVKLEMPSAGKVIGEYFVSDTFQFDFKAPSDDWQFFEDKEDKKLLVGLLYPGRSGEIRIYYENNLENTESDKFFDGYLRYAQSRFKNLKHEKVKISNLDGYRVKYLDERTDSPEVLDLSELISLGNQPRGMVVVKKDDKRDKTPREVVKFMLIQKDGVVSIECSAKQADFGQFAEVFDRINENFTLTLTRRW